MTRALVTGATGLVGSHIVERLLAEGWGVRAVVRSAPASARIAGGVEVVSGDVLDRESFERAAGGCDVIFNSAAAITVRGGWNEYERVNVGATRNAVDAARSSGARLVHISSVAVYGAGARYSSTGRKTGEDTELAPLPESAHYGRSKRESEAIALEAHRRGQVWATAVRPDVIYGPRDRQFVPRIARVLSAGIAPLIGSGRNTLAVVHAANVADGAYRAAVSDVAGGQAYNLANDFDVTAEEFFSYGAQGLGRRVLFVRVPLWAARGGLKAVRAVDGVFGGRYNVATAGSLNFMSRDNPFTSERAKSELGWAPQVKPEDGVPAAFAWWKRSRQPPSHTPLTSEVRDGIPPSNTVPPGSRRRGL